HLRQLPGTGIVANSIQNLPAFVDSGQHSIVTVPADTDPSPRMRNLTLRASGSTSLLPAPVVALSCRGFSILIIAFPLWVTPGWATVYHLERPFLVGTSRWTLRHRDARLQSRSFARWNNRRCRCREHARSRTGSPFCA